MCSRRAAWKVSSWRGACFKSCRHSTKEKTWWHASSLYRPAACPTFNVYKPFCLSLSAYSLAHSYSQRVWWPAHGRLTWWEGTEVPQALPLAHHLYTGLLFSSEWNDKLAKCKGGKGTQSNPFIFDNHMSLHIGIARGGCVSKNVKLFNYLHPRGNQLHITPSNGNHVSSKLKLTLQATSARAQMYIPTLPCVRMTGLNALKSQHGAAYHKDPPLGLSHHLFCSNLCFLLWL